MPVPSKQEKVYEYMLRLIREQYPSGGKLPNEHDLAASAGVARRTLRYILERLESEGMIVRTNHGTFVSDAEEKTEYDVLSVLVPCPDFNRVSGYYSSYLQRQFILGAMDAARPAGCGAVTIPISENNHPELASAGMIPRLRTGKNVMFLSGATPLALDLARRGCRIGSLSDTREYFDCTVHCPADMISFYLGDYSRCLTDAVNVLYADGARKIACLACGEVVLFQKGLSYFQRGLSGNGLSHSPDLWRFYHRHTPFSEVLQLIRIFYAQTHFDALIFDSHLYAEEFAPFDFYEATELPRSTRLLLTVSELLKQPELSGRTRVLHRPVRQCAGEIGRFLLSRQQGRVLKRLEYVFPRLNEFLNDITK